MTMLDGINIRYFTCDTKLSNGKNVVRGKKNLICLTNKVLKNKEVKIRKVLYLRKLKNYIIITLH